MEPIISIITPTYNRGDILETAIQSVYAQKVDGLEFIIMDGGSTDNTREIVSRYPEIRFYSEPDEGLYDAVNKGIHLARGQYIGWLNSDDFYPDGSLFAAVSVLKENPNLAAVFGDAEVRSLHEKQKPVLIPGFRQEGFLKKVSSDSFSINAGLIKRSVFDKLNYFDLAYKIASDRDFMFRFGLAGFSFGTIMRVLYVYQMSPTSLTFSRNINGKVAGDLEEMKIAVKYLQQNAALDKRDICTAWHSRASADAAWLSLLSGNRQIANEIKIQGIQLDRDGWQKAYTRGVFMYYVRKIFSPQIRACMSKFKKYLGYS
jgi:Glycosyltransferases involved in cell wall biogenesis